METFEKIIQESERPIIVFVGCGLSIPEPTCLPLNQELISSFLELDWVKDENKIPLNLKKINNSNIFNLRFEYLLSTFVEWRRFDLAGLFCQFADAPCNPYHKKIAELCSDKKIHAIITTNFDCCLENAIGEEKGIFPNVIVSKDNEWISEENTINIFKIHGSAEKRDGKYIDRDMNATLESVSNGLAPWKKALLEKMLDGSLCLFFGYSGSDTYDINPVLESIQNPHFLWIAHTTEEIDPFIYPELIEILKKSAKSQPVYTNTASFLGIPESEIIRTKRFQLCECYGAESYGLPSRAVGRVLEAVNDYKGALDYYNTVIGNYNSDKYFTVDIADIHRSKAVCHYELKQYEDAKGALNILWLILSEYADRGKNESAEFKDKLKNILNDQFLLYFEELALVSAALNEKDSAFSNISKAINFWESWKSDEHTKASCYSRLLLNLGSICLQFKVRSIKFTDNQPANISDLMLQVHKLKRQTGDYGGLIKSLLLHGNIYLNLEKQPEKALEKFTEMVIEVNKLATYIDDNLYEVPVNVFGMIVISNLSKSADKLHNIFLKDRSFANVTFRNALKKIMGKHYSGDCQSLLNKMVNDETVRNTFGIFENESSMKKNLANPNEIYLKELQKTVDGFGATIISNESKLIRYINDLSVIEGIEDPSEKALTYASQYHLIGDQFKKIGDFHQAQIAYENAYNSIKNQDIGSLKSHEEKQLLLKNLRDLISDLSVK